MLPGHNLMITAHWDDETLFAHSEISKGDWFLVVVTGGDDRTKFQYRVDEFKDVVENNYNCPYVLLNNNCDWEVSLDYNKVYLELENIYSRGYDNVLTHNSEGEYGHPHHKQIYSIVENLVKENLYVFDKIEPLPLKQLSYKLEMLKLYESQYRLEAFDWYDQNNPTNRIIDWVTHEGYRKIK